MKCSICRKNIEENFLNKLFGTIVKDEKGKAHAVCNNCQKKFKTKESILAQLK